MKILLVDDDELLVDQLTADLTAQNYVVDTTTDGLSGWQYAATTTYDLIVLDINLPRLDGLSLCQRLRQTGYTGAILLLTAQSSSTDKVMGLDAGADDYLVKPYTPMELTARLRALLRRPQLVDSPTLQWGPLELSANTGQVSVNTNTLSLSPKEYGLLELLLRHPQRIFSNTMLLERLWSLEDVPGEETIRTHIKRLRRKLKQAGVEDMIENVYGMGYRLKPPPSIAATDQIAAARAAAVNSFERFKPTLDARLEALKQAASTLEQGHLPPEIQQSALAAAHKLSGSLGLFGLESGSYLAHTLEAWLQTPHLAEGKTTFCALVKQLQHLLQAPPLAPSSAGDQPLGLASPSGVEAANQVVGLSHSASARILVITDSPSQLDGLRASLEPWGWEVIIPTDCSAIWVSLDTWLPDAIILDLELVELNPLALCQHLRQRQPWQTRPILGLAPHHQTPNPASIYNAGADDFLLKPWNAAELVNRLSHHLERYRLRQLLSGKDWSTGLTNRHRATVELELLLKLAQRSGQPLSLLLLRLMPQAHDPAEELNHPFLTTLSQTLPDLLSSGDVLASWERAELLLGLWNTDLLTAQERLRHTLTPLLARSSLAGSEHRTQVNLQLGTAAFPNHDTTIQGLYRHAVASLIPL